MAMAPLTDAQLNWLFLHGLSTHNGSACGRRLAENGIGPERICGGHAIITEGKLKLSGTCGEPCSYVCKEAGAFAEELERVVRTDKLIIEARSQE